MDKTVLVADQIAEGRRLLVQLTGKGFDITVAGWLQTGEEDRWYLYIASKVVDDRGIADAYRTVYSTIQANPEFGIDPFDVKLIDRQNPITKDLLDIRGAGVSRIATRSRRPRLGQMSVDETYVYAA